ncbi:MAG TPA: helix-turn-helix transcriptional regulator [Puia sp.]
MRSKIAKKILSETPEEERIFVRQYTNIVVRIHELLKRNGFTQKDLADKMNKKPSEVNKWLKGNHNLTLKTIAKLEAELGDSIICAVQSKRKKQSTW